MPISVSMYSMPFFFDIFKPSQLRLFSKKTLSIIIELKHIYKQKIYLDNHNILNSYILEDIIWNCFALFNYKFTSIYKKGFLNYYFSILCVLKHFELNLNRETCLDKNKFLVSEKINKIKMFVPYFIEALILNGVLMRKDLLFLSNLNVSRFIKFTKNSKSEIDYMNEAIQLTKPLINKYAIMRLDDMCRIAVKSSMSEFGVKTVSQLNCLQRIKDFLIFEQEFINYFEYFKNLFNSNQ
jgi:hypothetical protein